MHSETPWRPTEEVVRCATAIGWTVQTIEFTALPQGGFRFGRTPGKNDIPGILRFWKPDGLLVYGGGRQTPFDDPAARPVPVVFADMPPDMLPPGSVCVWVDNEEIARAAARELLVTGRKSFAYIPYAGNPGWSRERGAAFARLVREAGHECREFPVGPGSTPALDLGRLRRWLSSVPKPCGVFAACDRGVGEGVLVACEHLGLSVPGDVAVVAVDNVPIVCENTRPTLSSIEVDLAACGRIAFKMLRGMLERGEAPISPRRFGVLRVVSRASSRLVRTGDRRALRALEHIRLHACDPIRPPEVIRVMGVSRSQANDIFRAATGHTILDEIHAVRMAAARELMLAGVREDAIADRCGYASAADMRRVFRRLFGTTMRAWAAANRRR